MKNHTMVLSILISAALAGCGKLASDSKINASASTSINSNCEITSQGIGKILLNDTKDSILKKIPFVKFENSADGEGVEWLVATYEGVTVFIAEGDFSYLQVENDVCKTKLGAAVGMKVERLEQIYGKTLRVTTNDANAEQEVFFEKSPKNISFKGYDLGNFEEDKTNSHSTKKINPNGIVEMISVSSVN